MPSRATRSPPIGAGQQKCSGKCTDVRTDSWNCGRYECPGAGKGEGTCIHVMGLPWPGRGHWDLLDRRPCCHNLRPTCWQSWKPVVGTCVLRALGRCPRSCGNACPASSSCSGGSCSCGGSEWLASYSVMWNTCQGLQVDSIALDVPYMRVTACPAHPHVYMRSLCDSSLAA